VKYILTSVLLLLVVLPVTAQAGQYNWEQGCFSVPLVQRCWATNFDPNAGSFGSQSRTDNLNALPTWNGIHSYGDPSLPATTCGGDPAFGGDVVGAGSDANCSTNPPTCAYPPEISCNRSASQFVTQSYTDANGAWHFAMGGANQCMSDGHEVPCNVQHKMYPYDCRDPGPNCSSAGSQDMPFTWGFPSSMYFEMRTNLYVGGAAGPWHSFLCANIANSVNGSLLEICDEAYNSTGHVIPTGVRCNGGGFATWWQPAGVSNSVMATYGTPVFRAGVGIAVRWTMSRTQFINLINTAHNACGASFPADTAMDNWKLRYSQNGIEEIGAAGYGAGITFQVSDETMITWY